MQPFSNTVGTVGRPHGHRGSTVFLHRRADLRSDLVDGVVPTDALPLARAALATLDATQRVLQTVRIVDALRLGVALHAETAARRVVARKLSGRNAHHFAFTHDHLRWALAAAVASTGSVDRMLAFRSYGARARLRRSKLGQRATSPRRCRHPAAAPVVFRKPRRVSAGGRFVSDIPPPSFFSRKNASGRLG